MARRKASVTAKNQNLTRLRLGRATTEAFDASRAKLRAAVMASEPGVYSAAQLWDDSWWVEAVDKFVAPVLWDAYMRSAFESLPVGSESIPPWVFRSAERSWRAQVNRVRHLGVTVGKRVAVLADTGQGETRGWMLDRLGLVAAAGPLSEGIEDGLVLTEGDTADQGGLSAGAELQQGFKTWVAAGANTRPTHAEADGQVVGFDELFVVGGEECEFPGDPALSDAEAINCQCETDYSMEDPREVEIVEEWTLYANSYMDIPSWELEPLDPDKLYTRDEYIEWAKRVGLEIPPSELGSYEEVRLAIHREMEAAYKELAEKQLGWAAPEAAAAAEVASDVAIGEIRSLSDFADRELRGPWTKAKSRAGLPNTIDPLKIGRATSKAGRVQAAVDDVIAQIESIHGVPADVQGVTFHTTSGQADGLFRRLTYSNGDSANLISIADSATNMNTVAHELGHYFDWVDMGTAEGAYGTGSWSLGSGLSGASDAMEGVLAALYDTPEIRSIVSLYEEAKTARGVPVVIGGKSFPAAQVLEHTEYLLRPKEVWARAYAQFVAEESANEAMLYELFLMESQGQASGISYAWASDSFAPVHTAMRETLRLAGVA